MFSEEDASEEYLRIEASDNPNDYEFDGEWPIPPRRADPKWLRDVMHLIVLSYWKFHKTDADPWPSVLHGHHSEQPFKLDTITGDIFNIHTRTRVQKLKAKELARVQAVLRNSKDFGERARVLL
jgi:hypothetical protein